MFRRQQADVTVEAPAGLDNYTCLALGYTAWGVNPLGPLTFWTANSLYVANQDDGALVSEQARHSLSFCPATLLLPASVCSCMWCKEPAADSSTPWWP